MAEPADINVDELRRRARRRLVGAVVLALGVAVVVPMLLETEQKPLGEDVSVKIPPIDDGKFVNRLSENRAKDGAGAAATTSPRRTKPRSKRPRRRTRRSQRRRGRRSTTRAFRMRRRRPAYDAGRRRGATAVPTVHTVVRKSRRPMRRTLVGERGADAPKPRRRRHRAPRRSLRPRSRRAAAKPRPRSMPSRMRDSPCNSRRSRTTRAPMRLPAA